MVRSVSTVIEAPPGLAVRAAARVIDTVVVSAVAMGAGSLTGFGIAWLVATAVGVYAYFVVLDATWGTTVGKRLVGLGVVGPAGAAPGPGAAARRELVVLIGAVPFVGPVLALAAWIAIALSARSSPTGQGVHDRFAGGTRVVRRP
jgi:uncharacterized RDD family membrane protein YckC